MARGFPSMTALLGLLAVAGYQNRDKIAEMLRGAQGQAGPGQGAPAGGTGGSHLPGYGDGGGGGLGGLLGQLTGGAGGQGGGQSGGLGGLLQTLAGGGAGSFLGGGLNELAERFNETGHGDAVQSWVSSGPNKPVQPSELEQAIGPDVLDQLTRTTGLPRQELLARLSRELPEAVNRYTPDGKLPDPGGESGPTI
jgi:uncharacterized protein YidB (DUF937 family)